MSDGLFDSCCKRCTHRAAQPCSDYLACRLSGPFCHTDPDCERAKAEAARRIAFGPGGLVGVGQGDCGRAVGSAAVLQLLDETLGADFEVVPVGCLGFCSVEPTVWLARPDEPLVLFGEVTPEDAVELGERLQRGELWERKIVAHLPSVLASELTYRDNRHLYSVEEVRNEAYHYFLDKQMRLVTAHCGLARPTSLDDHLMRNGLHALFMLLRHYTAEDAFYLIEEAGLLARESGEPVVSPWREFAALGGGLLRLDLRDAATNPTPFVRRLLEGWPFAVIEALMILGRLTGSTKAEIVLPTSWEVPFADSVPPGDLWLRYRPRGEAPVANLTAALAELSERGLLGDDILGFDFDFQLNVVTTPTRVDKVLEVGLETLLNLPPIIELGGEWFRGFGHGRAAGTKCFLVGGPLTAHGYCELNLGTPLEEVVELVCGGGRPEPIEWVRLDAGPRVTTPAFKGAFDYLDGDEDGLSIFPPPRLVSCYAVAETERERPAAVEEAGVSRGVHSLLTGYRQLPEPEADEASVLFAWRLVGQCLERLSQGRGEFADLNRLTDWAEFLRYNAGERLADWAEILENALNSQGISLLAGGGVRDER